MLTFAGKFDLLHPAWLVALGLLPLIVFAVWRTTTMMLPWQRVLSAVCRGLIFLLLVLAAVRP